MKKAYGLAENAPSSMFISGTAKKALAKQFKEAGGNLWDGLISGKNWEKHFTKIDWDKVSRRLNYLFDAITIVMIMQVLSQTTNHPDIQQMLAAAENQAAYIDRNGHPDPNEIAKLSEALQRYENELRLDDLQQLMTAIHFLNKELELR